MNNIKVTFINNDQMQASVDSFCKIYPRALIVPVDVEGLIEFDLKLELIPISDLYKDCKIDALLLSNMKTIMVDLNQFMDENQNNRLRFTLAHEIGHYHLHKEIYKNIKFNDVSEWLEFLQKIDDKTYDALEYQANEFAGRLLIPKQKLSDEYNKMLDKIPETDKKSLLQSTELINKYMARAICPTFGVSFTPVKIRLEREGFK